MSQDHISDSGTAEIELRNEVTEFREAIKEGFHDLIAGRSLEFTGSLSDLMAEAAKRESSGW